MPQIKTLCRALAQDYLRGRAKISSGFPFEPRTWPPAVRGSAGPIPVRLPLLMELSGCSFFAGLLDLDEFIEDRAVLNHRCA